MQKRTARSQKPDTIIKAERTPFQAEQMPLVCRGALGRLRPLAVDLDEQSRGRTRTTKPNEHQANEHPPLVRAPGTSSIVRCSRTRRTTLRAGPSTSQDLSRTWRRWAHSKHCGQRSTRPAHIRLMPSKSATQFIAGKTHSFMVGRVRYEARGSPFLASVMPRDQASLVERY